MTTDHALQSAAILAPCVLLARVSWLWVANGRGHDRGCRCESCRRAVQEWRIAGGSRLAAKKSAAAVLMRGGR